MSQLEFIHRRLNALQRNNVVGRDLKPNYKLVKLEEKENPPLDFDAFRMMNTARQFVFKNAKGELIGKTDDWTPAEWLESLTGELGEYANWRKKFRRGDITEEEFLVHAEKELADVFTYLDLLAKCLGIDLGDAVRRKFNEVSDRIGEPEYKL